MKHGDITRIRGRETLIAELGYWPEFCDSKLFELVFDGYSEKPPKLSISLRYIDMVIRIDIKIRFVLRGVSDMNLNEFVTENVIDKLSISEQNAQDLLLDIEACSGLYGFCKCKEIDVEIISSIPYQLS